MITKLPEVTKFLQCNATTSLATFIL